MKNYAKHVAVNNTPLTSPIIGKEQNMTINHDGSYVFKSDKWTCLNRFLILGSEGPTYYVSEQTLTVDNVKNVQECIKEDGVKVVQILTDISTAGRAVKNDPALFVLAMCSAFGDELAKKASYESLSKVARIGTHLFHYVNYVSQMRGFGRGLKTAIANWFNNKKADALALQMVKYFQRDGWSMTDVLRVSHPIPSSDSHNKIFNWATKGWETLPSEVDPNLKTIWAYEKAKTETSEKEIVKLISDYKLPWEALDTKWLNSNYVWEALIENIKPEALMRNLGRLSANDFIKPLSKNLNKICDILTNDELIISNRLHPLKILVALKTYSSGHGLKGSLSWSPNQKVVDALNEAYYKSFKTIEPSNKRTLLALDVSGSMSWGQIAGMPLTPREACAAMAMIIAKTEPNYHIMAFCDKFVQLNITPKMSLEEVLNKTDNLPFGGTNCSLPMKWALENKIEVDNFVVLTDNDTNSGSHPIEAFDQYKKKTGLNSKFTVVSMLPYNFSIADASRNDNLDVVGFDTATPQLISNFAQGKI